MLIVQGLNVPCMAAPQKIRIVPNKAKKAVVTPKKPTKKGPTQKSNRSPPISVPPRTRYFRSKLSTAIFAASECGSPRGPLARSQPDLNLSLVAAGGTGPARSAVLHQRSAAVLGSGDFKPVETVGAQKHEVDHRREQKQERALRHENAAGVEDEPDLVEFSHFYTPSLEPREPDEGRDVCDHCNQREQPKAAHVD